MFKGISCISLCACCFLSWHWAALRRVWTDLLYSLHQVFTDTGKTPPLSLLSRLKREFSLWVLHGSIINDHISKNAIKPHMPQIACSSFSLHSFKIKIETRFFFLIRKVFTLALCHSDKNQLFAQALSVLTSPAAAYLDDKRTTQSFLL